MTYKPFISDNIKQSINFNIDQLFSRLKIRLLGPFYQNDNLLNTFNHDKTLSLPGIYISAYADTAPNLKPTYNALQSLAAVTESYIDSASERTKARAINAVQNALQSAARQDDFDYESSLNGALHNVFDQAHGEVKRVVETELQRTKTIGLQEGILDVMASQGIDDPTVAFAVKKDKFLCKYCRDFFLHDDGVTPVVYKLSELSAGYLDKKNPTPVLPPVHPNCFLYGQGRVLTNKGFKRIKNVSFGDTVLTHKNRYRGIENTLNFLKNPYSKNFYQIKLNTTDSQSICVTPDHEVLTDSGMKPIFKVDPFHDRLVKIVKKCIGCSKKMNFAHPQYFCSKECREGVFNNIPKYIDKIKEEKVEVVDFPARDLIIHHERTEPTFLYDITVKEDHSLTYNGLVTKNCRCILFGVYNGFGFNKAGVLEYKHDGYDEYEAQKGMKKNIDITKMVKHDCNEHRETLSFFNSK